MSKLYDLFVDNIKCVNYSVGKKMGYTFDNNNFHNVSLGQGQEVIAEQALDLAAKKGHWVILQVQPTLTYSLQLQGSGFRSSLN